MTITPQEFVSKWKHVTARENTLSDEEILEKLLALNLERSKE
jgi:hypothetical protein